MSLCSNWWFYFFPPQNLTVLLNQNMEKVNPRNNANEKTQRLIMLLSKNVHCVFSLLLAWWCPYFWDESVMCLTFPDRYERLHLAKQAENYLEYFIILFSLFWWWWAELYPKCYNCVKDQSLCKTRAGERQQRNGGIPFGSNELLGWVQPTCWLHYKNLVPH